KPSLILLAIALFVAAASLADPGICRISVGRFRAVALPVRASARASVAHSSSSPGGLNLVLMWPGWSPQRAQATQGAPHGPQGLFPVMAWQLPHHWRRVRLNGALRAAI